MNVPAPATRTRNDAIDLVRGFVMVVMALDHSRDFVMGFGGGNPTDLDKTTLALFFTRWITHFCAPVFVLLAGTGAWLARRRRTPRQLAWFLFTRGLWLILLEPTVVRFGWVLDLTYHFAILQVIWAIGVSMVLLSALVFLPTWAIATFGGVMVLGHNLLDGIQSAQFGRWAWAWDLVHEKAMLHPAPDRVLFLAYPLVPWVGVMALGYALGAFITDPAKRRRRLLLLGAGLTLAFIALRASNLYGDPEPWAPHPRGAAFTFLSFLNCEKYPPSLCYLLMTLGPALLALGLLDGRAQPMGGLARPLVVYGRVPLFYYLLHLFVIHLVVFALYRKVGTPNWGLPVTYLVWLVSVALLYWPCKRYAAFKARSTSAWVSYL